MAERVETWRMSLDSGSLQRKRLIACVPVAKSTARANKNFRRRFQRGSLGKIVWRSRAEREDRVLAGKSATCVKTTNHSGAACNGNQFLCASITNVIYGAYRSTISSR